MQNSWSAMNFRPLDTKNEIVVKEFYGRYKTDKRSLFLLYPLGDARVLSATDIVPHFNNPFHRVMCRQGGWAGFRTDLFAAGMGYQEDDCADIAFAFRVPTPNNGYHTK